MKNMTFGTFLCCMMLSFLVGFICCHKIYAVKYDKMDEVVK
jgi:hypothetical protein